jgi:hypothetical protein
VINRAATSTHIVHNGSGNRAGIGSDILVAGPIVSIREQPLIASGADTAAAQDPVSEANIVEEVTTSLDPFWAIDKSVAD